MNLRWAKLGVLLVATAAFASAEERVLHRDEFRNMDQWIVEQAPGGSVRVEGGQLVIRDAQGCTVWFRHKLKAPVSIRYEARVSSAGRVSDLNCFWMASDPGEPSELFHSGHRRDGTFATYDVLRTYYVGYGGNSNTTTRFRRYEGGGVKPLRPDHDLTGARVLIEPDRVYQIELIAANGFAKFVRDGEVLFVFKDPAPLAEGWFGIRTVDAVIEIRNFRVLALDEDRSVTGG